MLHQYLSPIQSKLSVYPNKIFHFNLGDESLTQLDRGSLSDVAKDGVICPGEVFGSFEIYRPIDQIEYQE